MKVSEVMSKAVIVDDTISLREAAKIMSKKNIANVIVVKDGKIIGYVSERDVLSNLNSLDKKVTNSMSRKIITVNADDDISEAGKIMANSQLKRLPVIKNGKLVGAISFRDVIRYLESSSAEEGDFFFN